MQNLKNAELIKGVVHLRLAIPHRQHGEPHAHVTGWLWMYSAYTKGVQGGNGCHIRMDWDNMPQPDCVLFVQSECGGQAKIDAEGYLQGAPELIVEVTASSGSYDFHDKLQVYEHNDVREYIVWRVEVRELDWFVLRNQNFEKLIPEKDGTLRSTIFPGLWLDTSALLNDNFDRLLDVLQSGLDSPEHADFVARMRRAGGVDKS